MKRKSTPLRLLRVGEEVEIDRAHYLVESIRDIDLQPLSPETYRRHPHRQRARLCIRFRDVTSGRKLTLWGYRSNRFTPICLHGLTDHAVTRMKERGITAQDINVVVALGGRHVQNVQGKETLVFRLNEKKFNGYPRDLRNYFEAIRRVCVVMASDGIVVTVYEETRKRRKLDDHRVPGRPAFS